MRSFMKDINTFKMYMTDCFRPQYLIDYVNELDDKKLEWFYNQVREPMEFLVDESYFYYKFNWIRKREFKDLSLEIYIEYLCNSELFTFPIIKKEWEDILYERYKDKIKHLLFP